METQQALAILWLGIKREELGINKVWSMEDKPWDSGLWGGGITCLVFQRGLRTESGNMQGRDLTNWDKLLLLESAVSFRVKTDCPSNSFSLSGLPISLTCPLLAEPHWHHPQKWAVLCRIAKRSVKKSLEDETRERSSHQRVYAESTLSPGRLQVRVQEGSGQRKR